MAPPPPLRPTTWLSARVTWETIRWPPLLRMPPPRVTAPKGPIIVVPVALPSAIVKRVSSTSVVLPLMLKTRVALLPLMVKSFSPRPWIVRSSVMLNSLPSVMVPCKPPANLIRSAPGLTLASRIACRSESRPLSARLWTVKVLRTVRSSSRSTLNGAARDRLRRRVGRCPFSMPDGTKRERVDRSQDDIRIARTPWEDWSAIQWRDIVPARRPSAGAVPGR